MVAVGGGGVTSEAGVRQRAAQSCSYHQLTSTHTAPPALSAGRAAGNKGAGWGCLLECRTVTMYYRQDEGRKDGRKE